MKPSGLEIYLIRPWMHHRSSRVNLSGVRRRFLNGKRRLRLKQGLEILENVNGSFDDETYYCRTGSHSFSVRVSLGT